MLKRKEASTENIDDGSSSFILNKAARLSEDLDESEHGIGETLDTVSLRGAKRKNNTRGTKKKVAGGLGVRRSSRLKKKS
jgi:hypothetical protein